MSILTGCVTKMTERWKNYDAGPFTFSMPSSFATDASKHGIDSYVRVFTNTDMVLNFDYGAYSGYPLGLDDEVRTSPGFVSHTEGIAGCHVQIVSFEGDMQFPQHFNHNIIASFLGAGLTMQVACATKPDYDNALRIFRSVKFKRSDAQTAAER